MKKPFLTKIQFLARLSGLWLLVSLWWGYNCRSLLQIHNLVIRQDFLFLIPLTIVLLLFGFWQERLVWLIEMGVCLLGISVGLVITQGVMNYFRGRPGAGAAFFARQVSACLHLLGKNNIVLGSTIIFEGKKITCDLIKMGFFPWLAFLLTFAGIILLSRVKLKKKIFGLLGGGLLHYLFLIFRFALLSLFIPKILLAGLGPFNLFYWRTLLLFFLPLLGLWINVFFEGDFGEGIFHQEHQEHKGYLLGFLRNLHGCFNWQVCLGLLVISCLVTLSIKFDGFPLSKNQKIHCVIDEIHSNWESSQIDFNLSTYGLLAENSYHSLVDYLRHFHQVTILSDKISLGLAPEGVQLVSSSRITSEQLRQLEASFPNHQLVLILKCITSPFSEAEIEVIRGFVHKGGRVFLIGDHTDVFFMNKHLNELSHHFGIRFEQNSVYFVDGGWVITDPSNYPTHPVTRHLGKFIWATGDSLSLKSPAFPLIYSSQVCFADEVNYFFDNFFGNTKIDPEEIFGSYCLLAASHYGQGKVVAFTDSTCFNNYLMFTVGRRELLTGIFGWLGQEGRVNPFPWLTLMAFGLFGLFIFKYYRKYGCKHSCIYNHQAQNGDFVPGSSSFRSSKNKLSMNRLLSYILSSYILSSYRSSSYRSSSYRSSNYRLSSYQIIGYLFFTFLGFWIGSWVGGCGQSLIHSPPLPIRPLPAKVVIEAAHQPQHCLSYGCSEEFLAQNSYDNLIFTLGRLNIFPEIWIDGQITAQALKEAAGLILVSPTKDYTNKERKIIQEYVEGGGSLLIIEGASPGSSINQIAGLFNLHIRLHPDKEKIKKISLDLTNRFRNNLENNPAWIEGGQPLFCLQDMPIISFERKGKGFVLVFGDNYFFIKKNFIFAERELVTFQSTLITALINKDENLLKVFMSNFFKVGGLEHD